MEIVVKITRYVNGRKINKGIDNEFLIRQPVVADTIQAVNSRLNLNRRELKDKVNE